MKTWTREQLDVFLEVARGDRHYPLYVLAAHSGMRRGELLGLKWDDVKLGSASISVQEQLGVDDDGEDDLMGRATKTPAGRRSIKLEPFVVAVLREHQQAQQFERNAWGDGYRGNLVFCLSNGSPYHPDTITGQFERACRKSGLPLIRLHDLRHTHATLWLEAGGRMLVLSQRLGHASQRTTADRYAHVTDPLQDEDLTRFAAYMEGAREVRRDTAGIPESSERAVGGRDGQGQPPVVLNTIQGRMGMIRDDQGLPSGGC